MLRLTVDVVPHGDEQQKHTIATVNLENVTPFDDVADYEVTGVDSRGPFRCLVEGHRRNDGWRWLVLLACAEMIAQMEGA